MRAGVREATAVNKTYRLAANIKCTARAEGYRWKSSCQPGYVEG